MSQLSQQNDGPFDAQLQSSPPHSSPTVGQSQALFSPNHHSFPESESGKRSQRRAAPSPLQTSTTAASSPPSSVTPTTSTFSRTAAAAPHQYSVPAAAAATATTEQSSRSSPQEEPRTPQQRLDDLLASEKSFYTTEDSSTESDPSENSQRYGHPLHYPNGSSRSVSDPLLPSQSSAGGSPTSRRPPMAATAPQHRIDTGRAPPRTSSIDSALSSVSGGTRSQKPAEDMRSSTESPDVAHLIQTAGSAEAVIQFLLKEKRSQAAQNAQLWRLVDKQRAMILGLNKDLERSLKDKERYRKKLKESIAQISHPSPVDSNQGVSSDTASVTSDSRPVETPKATSIVALVSARLRNPEPSEPDDPLPSPIDVALAPYPITPPANHVMTPALSNMVEAEHQMPSPTQHAFQQYNPDTPAAGFEAGQQQRKAAEVTREVPYSTSLPPSRSLPSDPPRGPPPRGPPPKAPATQAPAVKVMEATPLVDQGLQQFPSPPRKGPPAPLNLGKKNNASSHLRQTSGAGEESDSDYDDILEVDEIPAFPERGRRKTREEDDRDREIAAMKDAELRSLSKKSGKATPKSRPTTPKDGTFASAGDAMPTGHRPTVPIAPPAAHMRQFSPPDSTSGSLAGILSASQVPEHSSGLVSPPLMSPGLPLSPRPIDRGMPSPFPRNQGSGNNSTLNSPPMSPRGMGAFSSPVPLSPRAPRQPIPLPPNTPMSIASPRLPPAAEPLTLISPKPLVIAKKTANAASTSPKDDNSTPTYQSPSDRSGIYRGLVTEEYPDLLLPPNALPSIDVKVASSRLKPSRASLMFPKNGEEDPVFTLAVFSRSDDRELWRVEKDSASLYNLDQMLKQSQLFTAKMPERGLFNGHAPAKVDARRAALDKYVDEILNTQMDTPTALEICRYLSTNTVAPYAEDSTPGSDSVRESPVKRGPGGRALKNGYLTKRGKNFGGWKARFFVLDGPVLKYYESPGGPHLGAIKLQKAQIGKQQQQSDNQSPSRGDGDDADNQYRHAFLILEPKRKDSSSLVRHVLCAESDKERDQWVEALLQYVDFKDSDEDEPQTSKHGHRRTGSGGSSQGSGMNAKKKMHGPPRSQTYPELGDDLRGISYENTKQGSIPQGARGKKSGTPSPPTNGHEREPAYHLPQSQSMKSISAPKNAQVIHDAGNWGGKPNNMLAPLGVDDKTKAKKRSFFGFGSKPRVSTDSQDTPTNDSTTNLSQMAYEQHGPIRPAFGASLGEAVRYNHPVDVSIEIPAVVYRCIEYLDGKNAANEEGIFRLSGSNVVIKQLRERFNNEGDVNLMTDDQYYDIHAVASLLKLYLRELPTTILTRELHLEFLAVTELHDLNEKISALNVLVHRLPRANNVLLRYLSSFLITIISNADVNKMTVRNVGIVFSPTLNIPAPVFALFLQQYDGIFGQEPESNEHAPVEVTVTAPPLTPEDIRSPRRQKFQELPTPSYDQHSFTQSPQGPFTPNQYYQQQQRAAYDSGFTPLQPAYDPQRHRSHYDSGPSPLQNSYETQLQAFPTLAGSEYGSSRATTMAGPAYDQYNASNAGYRPYSGETAQSAKSKRRESSMFTVGMGQGYAQKKPSNTHLRNDSRLVDQESFFD